MDGPGVEPRASDGPVSFIGVSCGRRCLIDLKEIVVCVFVRASPFPVHTYKASNRAKPRGKSNSKRGKPPPWNHHREQERAKAKFGALIIRRNRKVDFRTGSILRPWYEQVQPRLMDGPYNVRIQQLRRAGYCCDSIYYVPFVRRHRPKT
jgi:hypothetical protein